MSTIEWARPLNKILEPAARASNELYECRVASCGRTSESPPITNFISIPRRRICIGIRPGQFEVSSVVRSRQLEGKLDSMFVQFAAIDEKSQRLGCFPLRM